MTIPIKYLTSLTKDHILLDGYEAWKTWLSRSEEGDEAIYHVGYLAADRDGNPPLERLARSVEYAAENGKILITHQKALPPTGKKKFTVWLYKCVRTSPVFEEEWCLSGRSIWTGYNRDRDEDDAATNNLGTSIRQAFDRVAK